jgi:glycosyltransferase involved in cell wall biosynthesis
MLMPDISIIIPSYNRLWCLPAAIESCRSDSCTTEIIVVDDGSDDGTWDWLKSQPDVIAIRRPNWGKPHAVNHGLSVATGEFVRFLDSDDLIAPDANRAQLAEARKTNADIVAAGYIARYERTNSEFLHPWTPCDDFIAQQLGECDSSHYSAYIFRRSFLNVAHRQEFAFRDDRMFMIEVALQEPKVAYVTIPCLIHQHHLRDRIQFQRGLVSVVTYWQELQMLKKAESLLAATGKLDSRRKKAIAKSLWPLAHRIAATHLDEACDLLKKIHNLDPDFQVPKDGTLGTLYRFCGFRMTERLVGAARNTRDLVRDTFKLHRAYSPPAPGA